MEHVLDNPAWNALISGNRSMSLGNGEAKFFDAQTSPFAGIKERTSEGFQQLYNLHEGESPRVVIINETMVIPKPWVTLSYMRGFQMVYESTANVAYDHASIVPLSREHVPQMLELTALTNPGPFAVNTIEFGHYSGVFDHGKLVAMAGQRLNPLPYAEISAVCTHPDHTGKGYAKQLLLHQANRIIAASQIPFLHVRHDNDRAIKVYEALGFKKRTEVHFYVIQK